MWRLCAVERAAVKKRGASPFKVEEVYLNDYANIDHARRELGRFIDDIYNQKSLHSSLGYVPPGEYEANLVAESQRPLCTTVGVHTSRAWR